MRDPWNGLIIGAQHVSRRVLARETHGRVGTGALPEELGEPAPPIQRSSSAEEATPNSHKISGTVVTS